MISVSEKIDVIIGTAGLMPVQIFLAGTVSDGEGKLIKQQVQQVEKRVGKMGRLCEKFESSIDAGALVVDRWCIFRISKASMIDNLL